MFLFFWLFLLCHGWCEAAVNSVMLWQLLLQSLQAVEIAVYQVTSRGPVVVSVLAPLLPLYSSIALNTHSILSHFLAPFHTRCTHSLQLQRSGNWAWCAVPSYRLISLSSPIFRHDSICENIDEANTSMTFISFHQTLCLPLAGYLDLSWGVLQREFHLQIDHADFKPRLMVDWLIKRLTIICWLKQRRRHSAPPQSKQYLCSMTYKFLPGLQPMKRRLRWSPV